MDLILIRHCQSEHNAELTHSLDSKLTPLGREQASRLRQSLATIPDLDKYTIRVSPFWRCLETAHIIFGTVAPNVTKVMTNDMTVDFSLRECGTCFAPHGLQLENHAASFPQFRWPTQEPYFCQAETPEEHNRRMTEVLENISTPSILISHGSPLLFLRSALLRQPPPIIEQWHPDLLPNGSAFWMSRQGKDLQRFYYTA